MRVRYSRRALLQLDEIHNYIAQFNPRAAGQVVARIEDLCEKLGDFPGMGHRTERADVRMLPVVRYPHLIFYTLMPENDVRDAVAAWIEEARALGRAVPQPSRRHVAAE